MKKRTAKKRMTKEAKIEQIIRHVTEMCDYAMDNMCTETCQFEELTCLLDRFIK